MNYNRENPPYYLSAYAIAVKHGYQGTEEQWNNAVNAARVAAEEAQSSAEDSATQSKSWAVGNTGERDGEDTNNASYYSSFSKSYAVGGTGIRDGEDTDNAQYYEKMSKSYAVGGTGMREDEETNNTKYYFDNAIDLIGDARDDAIEEVGKESTKQQGLVEQKGEEVLESIPEDYTELSEDVSQLKEDLGAITGNEIVTGFSKNKYIDLSTGTTDYTELDNSKGYSCVVIDCTYGEQFVITGTGGTKARLYGFVSSATENNIVDVAEDSATLTNTILTAPENAVKLVVNFDVNGGTIVKDKYLITKFNAEVSRTNNLVADYDNEIYTISNLDLSQFSTYEWGITTSTNVWAHNANWESWIIELPSGYSKLRIQASNKKCLFALLSSPNRTEGNTPYYATGCSRISLNADEFAFVELPSDAKYLWLNKTYKEEDRTPQYVKLLNSTIKTNISDITHKIDSNSELTFIESNLYPSPSSSTISESTINPSYLIDLGTFDGTVKITKSESALLRIALCDSLNVGDSVDIILNSETETEYTFATSEHRYILAQVRKSGYDMPSSFSAICYGLKYSQSILEDNVDDLINLKSTTKACIIGASIEAGTTHETASSGAVVDPTKAYLTVALERHGVTVSNYSHGGMGYLKPSSDGTVFKELLTDTSTIDFTEYDSCYLCLGSNDWAHSNTGKWGDYPLGSPSDSSSAETVCGVLRYALEYIYSANPYIKVFVKLPTMRGAYGDASTCYGWHHVNEATTPYTQEDLANAISEVCESYGITYYGGLNAVVNALNLETFYPDKTHPSKATMAIMALDMYGKITFY